MPRVERTITVRVSALTTQDADQVAEGLGLLVARIAADAHAAGDLPAGADVTVTTPGPTGPRTYRSN